MSDMPPEGSTGWWQASDGKWYPPESYQPPSPGPLADNPRWEYRLFKPEFVKRQPWQSAVDALNALGAEGWEVVNFDYQTGGLYAGAPFIFLLKRRTG